MIKFITSISEWAYRHSKPQNILLLLLLIVVMNAFVFPYYTGRIVPEGGPPVLDLHFGFTADEAYETLEAFGEEGRSIYMEMLLVADTIYPLIYGLFLIFLASFFLKRILKPDHPFRFINLLAVDAVIFDFLENAGIVYMIMHFPDRAGFVAGLTSVFNVLKWIMVGLAIALVLIALVIFIARRKHLTTTELPDA